MFTQFKTEIVSSAFTWFFRDLISLVTVEKTVLVGYEPRKQMSAILWLTDCGESVFSLRHATDALLHINYMRLFLSGACIAWRHTTFTRPTGESRLAPDSNLFSPFSLHFDRLVFVYLLLLTLHAMCNIIWNLVCHCFAKGREETNVGYFVVNWL